MVINTGHWKVLDTSYKQLLKTRCDINKGEVGKVILKATE